MKKYIVFIILMLQVCFSFAQKSDKEKSLDALIAAGFVRKQGDVYYFKVKNDKDASTFKILYGGLINNPDSHMKFEYPNQKPKASNQTNNTTNQVNNKSNNINTSGMANVDPAKVSAFEETKSCFTNLKTFGYVGVVAATKNTAISERSFTVPPGIFKIKIEAWSAGGHGWADIYRVVKERNPKDAKYIIIGGGGGSGAYYYGIINVFPGEIISIKVPSGGSTTALQIRIPNKGILKIENGTTATEQAKRPETFSARGGRIEMKSGVFEENFYSLNGTSGQHGYLSAYEDKEFNISTGNSLGAPQLPLPDRHDIHAGDGGIAPKSVVGGFGYKYLYTSSSIKAEDGGFPGGGGGGSTLPPIENNGKGAAGFVIFNY